MNNISSHNSKVNPSIPLFWRLFISLLLMLLLTSTIAVGMERWTNARALETRIAQHTDYLSSVRLEIKAALQAGNYDEVSKIYRNDWGLRNQIRIIDEQGNVVSPRLRAITDRNLRQNDRPPNSNSPIDSLSNQFIEQIVPDIEQYPQLADLDVTTFDGRNYTLQLQPRLPLRELVALRQTNLPIRVGIILIFSILACYWLSRTLTSRIRRVQRAVHRMREGDYLLTSDLSHLGADELGQLAQDIEKLSTRLAESELSRKQMLSDISHELRSPLARLEVATELTRDYAPEATRYLDRIQKESTRMNQLIAQIIHIQSLQMQRYMVYEEDYETVDIAHLLDEIGQDVCFEFQDKHIEWQRQRNDAEESWSVLGNREQLHSAFENIIRNAFIYSTPSTLVLAKIERIKQRDTTSALKVTIIDQGGGIADNDVERIFEPFVRLDTSRQRPKPSPIKDNLSNQSTPIASGGYGLGLAIAHAIFSAHRGQISAQNYQDTIKGLMIEVILPVKFTLL